MTEPLEYLVVGRDRAGPWSPGQEAEVYPVLESLEEFRAERSAAITAGQAIPVPSTIDVDAYTRAAAVALTVMRPPPRVQHRSGCRCSRKGSQTPLVKAYACDDGLWVWVRGPRIPDAARRPTTPLHEADTAWPVFWFAGRRPWSPDARSVTTTGASCSSAPGTGSSGSASRSSSPRSSGERCAVGSSPRPAT